MSDPELYDSIIIGAGAAGFFAAIEAGKRGLKVLLLDHSNKIGEKIRISGGGRCNFTNIGAGPENYISQNPHFCKSALASYTAQDFINLVEKHNIPYHEKKLGQLFCDRGSGDVITLLHREADRANVEILTNCKIRDFGPESYKDGVFEIETSLGDFQSSSIVIATGGLSIPQIGATDFGYKTARNFGLKIVEPKPALVPFTTKEDVFAELTGMSLDTVVSTNKTSFRENILFTHKGLSGPAILQISSYWDHGDSITIDTCPDRDPYQELVDLKKQSTKQIKSLLDYPDKFIDKLAREFDLSQKISETSNQFLQELAHKLKNWQITPTGTEGFAKAEVTVGGVDTNDLNSKTMEAKKVPGLYFIGEVVDVTGWLGGYNFQWAWASGFSAGNNC
ncbi:MAG: NAD(P)/FAD-dependent oxidoreductase [Candidatus Melainabacteria bacterium]|jgi:predicted Rossmann fold flavoprotein|nr:NAD(P)/FAD-dependent oxidoreductase [Candidatus Melainabacteria bacterium]